jgi:hypothetical protein
MATRIAGIPGTVTIGGVDWLGNCQSASVEFKGATAEGKGAADYWNDPSPVGGGYTISGDFQVAGQVALFGTVAAKTSTVPFVAAFSGNSFSGTALVTSLSIKGAVESLQTYAITMESKGTVTFA